MSCKRQFKNVPHLDEGANEICNELLNFLTGKGLNFYQAKEILEAAQRKLQWAAMDQLF